MKAKLTLSIDSQLIPRAKLCARKRGRSLSALVEESLTRIARDEEVPFGTRWRGRFKPANRGTPLYKALAEKYL